HKYHYFMIVIVALLYAIDANLYYSSWGTKINVKAFLFLNTPEMVVGAVDYKYRLILLALFVVQAFIGIYFYRKKIVSTYHSIDFSPLKIIPIFLILSGLIFIGIRGGLQEIPVNQGHVYYSHNPTLNTAAVNSLWNLGNTVFQNQQLNVNTYQKLDEEYAQSLVDDLYYVEKDTTISLFTLEKPNIVFITLEGVNANVLPYYGAEENHAPTMQTLIENHALLFPNFYSSGYRTDQGLAALMSGFPAQPLTTISAQPEKYAKLPSFPHDLQTMGYDCHFYFGGEAEFGSFKSFLMYSGFDPIIDFEDYPQEQLTQKLGAPDEFLFQKVDELLDTPSEPFYAHIMTQTTHEPYDMPFNEGVYDDRDRYLNTVTYTDSVLGDYLEKVMKKSWYENTIFILTCDHAHPLPGNYWYSDPNRFHIPFMLFGEPLKNEFIATQNTLFCSQTDIPATILKQLGQDNTSAYKWSKDMMNPYSKEFAFFVYVNGYIMQTPTSLNGWEYNYDVGVAESYHAAGDSILRLHQGQSYMQQMFQSYLDF
ncbi:MAG: LTA synthase family protein, partial [Chitinophagales bacterium]